MWVELTDVDYKRSHPITIDLNKVIAYRTCEFIQGIPNGTFIYFGPYHSVTTVLPYALFDELFKKWKTGKYGHQEFYRYPYPQSQGWGADGDEGFGI